MKIIVVHRSKETLDLYKHSLLHRRYLLQKSYRVAVGRVGLETPQGMYEIQNKSRKPDYRYPTSDWVPAELKGVLFPFGDPRNPIAGRWMGVTDTGVGIHGTFDDASVGTAASHGCVRLHIADIEELYDLVPLGTPVFIY